MKIYIIVLNLAALVLFGSKAYGQDVAAGEKIFTSRCQACHSIGAGKVVGPDLKDVAKRRTEEWIVKFVQSPVAVIQSGDETAVKLFEEHDKIPMPDHKDLKEGDIKNLIAYITEKSIPSETPPVQAQKKAEEPAPAQASSAPSPASSSNTLLNILIGIVIVLIIAIGYLLLKMFAILMVIKKVNKKIK